MQLTERQGLNRVFADYLLRHPALDSGPSPVAFQKADRHVKNGIQHFGEIPSGGGNPSRGLRCRNYPSALNRILDFKASGLRDLDLAYLVFPLSGKGYFLGRSFHRTEPETVERHLHIGLTSAEPYLAYENIAESGLPVLV